MKRLESSDVTVRINRFLDRKAGNSIEMSDLSNYKTRRSYRNDSVAVGTPFIALAVK